MATYYSILSVQIRPEIQEKISIGLLVVGEGVVFFNFSKNKLLAAKSLIPDTTYKLLKDSIKNIENTAILENQNFNQGKQISISNSFENNSFSKEYISYLSRYNNNVLAFSTPKQIDINPSQEVFFRLFSKFIDDAEIVATTIRTNTIDTFKAINRPRLNKHFNIEQEFTSDEIPHLIAPVKVDLLGKNEIPVYMQSIDLDRIVYHIENDLAQLFLLHSAFAYENLTAKGFVVTSEPSKKEIKQHSIWTQLRSNRMFEYVDISEAEKIIQYAEVHNVQPLIANNSLASEE